MNNNLNPNPLTARPFAQYTKKNALNRATTLGTTSELIGASK